LIVSGPTAHQKIAHGDMDDLRLRADGGLEHPRGFVHTALVQGTLVRDYVKWDDQPHSLAIVPESFLRAYRIAQTDPQGPIYVCYDAGLQEEVVRLPPTLPTPQRYAPSAPPQAHPEALERTADLLV